ncbi:MAG: hypothetical protein RL118_738 [Actinomycetota bacterium]|jgi:hypothetical protein
MKIRSIKLIGIALGALLVTGTLAACSSSASDSPVNQTAAFDESGEPTTPGEYGYGVSGSMLPAWNEDGDNLSDDDEVMADVCQYVEAFETGTLRMGGADAVVLERDELIADFRLNVLASLKYSIGDYPELDIYFQGAKEKLADPGQNTQYYQMLLKTCGPYNAMLTRTIANWVEPTTLGPDGCWTTGKPKNLIAYLQKKDGQKWVNIETVIGFTKGEGGCTDKDYPYGYSTTHTFWHDTEVRWVVKTLDGTKFNDGTKQNISDTLLITAGQASAW